MKDKRGLKSKLAEKASMLLSNLTRDEGSAGKVYKQMVKEEVKVRGW